MISRASLARSDESTGFVDANDGFIFLPAKASRLPGPIAGGLDARKKFLPAGLGNQLEAEAQ